MFHPVHNCKIAISSVIHVVPTLAGPDTSTGWVETTLTKRTRGFGLGPATGSVAGASAPTSWCRAGDGSTIPSRLGRRIVLLGPSLSFLEGSGPRQAGIRTHVATTFGSSVNWTRDQWQTLVLNKNRHQWRRILDTQSDRKYDWTEWHWQEEKVLAIHGEVKFILKWWPSTTI